jgi:tRNA U34 5-carboxymethylaminomethyl modifying GTPase MnmE/TrmE
MAKPTPKTPAQLKAIADAVNAKRQDEARIAQRNEDERLSKKAAAKIAECRAAIDDAAADGKYYTEVDIDDDIRARVSSELAEFKPTYTGDGYGRDVICLKWK